MERVTLGLSTMVIGMLVVFFGLAILIACIYGMTSITGRKSRKAAPEAAPAPVPVPEPAEEAEEAEDGGAVAAAITAAIALLWEKECREGRGIMADQSALR